MSKKKQLKRQKSYEAESAVCHELMFAQLGADTEEHLAGVLALLVKVANEAGYENLALMAEQQIIELTGLDV